MELKELVQIVKKHKKTFFISWVVVVALAITWFATRPAVYDTVFSIEIGRKAVKQTPEYQYDQYYRLEADDKFASTVAQWLKDPTVTRNILIKAEENVDGKSMRHLMKTFSGEKLSSNYLQVKFSSNSAESGRKIALAARSFFVAKSDTLNKESAEQGWFKLIFTEPVTIERKVNWLIVGVGSILGGFLLALFIVLGRNYFKKDNE